MQIWEFVISVYFFTGNNRTRVKSSPFSTVMGGRSMKRLVSMSGVLEEGLGVELGPEIGSEHLPDQTVHLQPEFP